MPLPNFSVTGNLFEIIPGFTGSELATRSLTSVQLLFTPNVRPADFVVWEGDLYRVRPVIVTVSSDGSISDVDDPVLLLANDGGLNVTGLQWQVSITTLGAAQSSVEWWFDAPANEETVDLATVARAPATAIHAAAGLTETQLLSLIADSGSDVRDALNAIYGGDGVVPLDTYMKPAKAPYPLSDVTTYAIDTTGPSYTTPFYYAYAAQASHFRWSAMFSDISGYGWNHLNGAGGALAPTPYEVEVYVSGDRVSFPVYAYGNHDIQILVDDMPLYQSATGTKIVHITNTEAVYYIKLQFASARTRKIRLLMPQIGFWGAITDSGATVPGYVWPAEPRFRVAVIADSFFHGTGSTTEGAITAMTMSGQLSMQLGWEFWNVVQGGTGYANPGSGTTTPPGSPTFLDKYGSSARLAALAALPSMDMVLVFGGANDADPATYPVATVVSNANTLWNAIKTARPSTPLLVGGVESGAYPSNATNLNTLNTALKAAAAANPNVTAYIDMRNPMWVNGTGHLGSVTGDGNADIFVSSDTVHPSHAGWEYEARRFKDVLAKIKVPAA